MIPANVEARFWAFVEKGAEPNECWRWTGSTAHGYGQMTARAIQHHPVRAPRISWAIHNGRFPTSDEHVLHSCDNPPCTNPLHLRLGTPAMNAKDRVTRGRDDPTGSKRRPGELNGVAKLTWAKVADIRHRPASIPHTDLAREFAVDPALIRRIRIGTSWRTA